MASSKKKVKFELGLSELEDLVKKMEEGGLTLEETLACYEAGIKLSKQLNSELAAVEIRLMQLKDGKVSPVEEEQL